MKRENIQKLTLAAMFLAIGMALPFVTGQIREIGKMLLPMHLSAIAMAFELATYGFVTGFLYGKSRWKYIRALYRAILVAILKGWEKVRWQKRFSNQ